MSFVVDASVVAALLLPDERPLGAFVIHDRMIETGAIAPMLLEYEFSNILLVNERRGRLSVDQSSELLDVFATLPVRMLPLQNQSALLRLARRNSLTVYDASYVQLAKQTGNAIATFDRAVIRAAQAEHVAII